jgi:hypothetical protein
MQNGMKGGQMPLKSEQEELNERRIRDRRNIFHNTDLGSVLMVSLFDPYHFTVIKNSCAD